MFETENKAASKNLVFLTIFKMRLSIGNLLESEKCELHIKMDPGS